MHEILEIMELFIFRFYNLFFNLLAKYIHSIHSLFLRQKFQGILELLSYLLKTVFLVNKIPI